MNLLILHLKPYSEIQYHRGIDHLKHNVTYIGTQKCIDNIPKNLRCEKIIRDNTDEPEIEVLTYIQQSKKTFDRIISLSEHELLTAAHLRERCHVSGPCIAEVELVRNKLAMKTAMQNAGIKTPEFMSIQQFMDNKNALKHAKKVLIKPVYGACSEDTITFEMPYLAREKIAKKETGIALLDQTKNMWNYFEIETFIDSPIFHVDGFVINGVMTHYVISHYIGNCLSYAQGKPLGSVQIDPPQKMIAWAQRCATTAKIMNGPVRLEFFVSKNEFIFLEIANRAGGGNNIKVVELATGLHLPSVELKLLLEEPIEITPHDPTKKFGKFAFPGHLFQNRKPMLHNAHLFKNNPCIIEWSEKKSNELCTPYVSYAPDDVPLAGIISADSTKTLTDFLHTLFSTVRVIQEEEVWV